MLSGFLGRMLRSGLVLFQELAIAICKKCFSLTFFLLLSSFSLSAQAVFLTPGQFSVGIDGDASYTIPIQIPSGTAGVAPKLSLSFSSQGHNGILGMGWGVDGLSQITRCPQNRAEDGVRAGVNYDTNDKFCLDGQRLVVVSGTYGGDGAEYRTSIANFSKIVSYGSAGNGPAWFKVWTKGGQIIEFGNTADSRIEAAGKSTARIWGVNKVTDTKGNYFTVTYVEDNPNGEAYISRIDYTGNATALTPYASVQFVYETRPDVSTQYEGGSVIKSTRRMTNIKAYKGAALVKDYRISYINTGGYSVNTSNTANGSLLTKIQECDGSATPVCLNPTTFTWAPATPVTTVFSTPSSYAATNAVASGDSSGDGMADSLYFHDGAACSIYSASGNFYLTRSAGSGYSGAGSQVVSVYGVGGGRKMAVGGVVCDMLWPKQLLGDINLDGYDDYISTTPVGGGVENLAVKLSAGGSFGSTQNWGAGHLVDIGDFNGDGKADILYDTSTASTPGTLYIGFSNGTAIASSVNTGLAGGSFVCQAPSGGSCGGYFYVAPEVAVGDFNGDGLADLLYGTGGTIYFSTGSGFGPAKNWLLGVHVVSVGDINGDGMADILYDTTTPTTFGRLYIAYSTGNEFVSVLDTGLTGGGGDAGGGYICAGLFDSSVANGCPAPYKNVYVRPYAILSDVNGDGLADLQYGGNGKIYFAASLSPDYLTTITTGLGETTTIAYSNLVNASLYTYETGSTYPIRDLPRSVLLNVVATATTSDGVGGVNTTNYSYGGAKADLSGRGSLGFRWVKEAHPDSGLTQTTFYRQDYPYTGLPSQMEKRTTSGTLIAVVQNTYSNQVLGGAGTQTQFPYLSQAVEQSFELDGSLIASTTINHEYDSYGNTTKTTVTTSDGHIKTTTNTYTNDTVNWFLGRLLRSAVTSSAP